MTGVGANQSDPVRETGLHVDVPKETRVKSGVDRQDIFGAEERVRSRRRRSLLGGFKGFWNIMDERYYVPDPLEL